MRKRNFTDLSWKDTPRLEFDNEYNQKEPKGNGWFWFWTIVAAILLILLINHAWQPIQLHKP